MSKYSCFRKLFIVNLFAYCVTLSRMFFVCPLQRARSHFAVLNPAPAVRRAAPVSAHSWKAVCAILLPCRLLVFTWWRSMTWRQSLATTDWFASTIAFKCWHAFVVSWPSLMGPLRTLPGKPESSVFFVDACCIEHVVFLLLNHSFIFTESWIWLRICSITLSLVAWQRR